LSPFRNHHDWFCRVDGLEYKLKFGPNVLLVIRARI
jgi:hypothetical protein